MRFRRRNVGAEQLANFLVELFFKHGVLAKNRRTVVAHQLYEQLVAGERLDVDLCIPYYLKGWNIVHLDYTRPTPNRVIHLGCILKWIGKHLE